MRYYERHSLAVDLLYDKLNYLIDEEILSGKKVVMFGTSNIAGIIIHYLTKNGVNMYGIIDNDKTRHGQVVYGLSVYGPEELLEAYDKDVIVLVASTYQAEMIAQLEAMGYKENQQVYVALDMHKAMNDYSFVDRTDYVPMTQEEVKKSQLGILKKLDKICTENNIRYYICGGTLLGAVRHGGYIPWDDDIDVVMPFKDIIKLSEVLREDEDYSLISFADDLEYFDICSLMVDNNTLCDFNGFMQLTSGVSIDVFPFIGVPEDEAERDEYIRTMRRLDSEKWNLMYDAKACKEALNRQVEYMLKFDYDRHPTIGNVLGRYFMKDIFPRAYFDETVRMKFEDIELEAPKNWDGYLKGLYGDYMKLPPKEKQVAVHYYKAYHKKQ